MLSVEASSGFRALKEVKWHQVRNVVAKVNSNLAAIIDDIDPPDNMPLLQVSYSFGDKIIENGRLKLLDISNNSGKLFSSANNDKLHDLLNYAALPLGLLLNKGSEVFFCDDYRIVPSAILAPGYTFGLFETLDSLCGLPTYSMLNLTAGARSLFMLPKINNNIGHKRLKKEFAIGSPPPKTLADHWEIFKELVNSKNSEVDWQSDILLFTSEWFEKLKDGDGPWSRFREYLFKDSWMHFSLSIEKVFSIVWQSFATSIIRRRYKPRIYVTDTIRHLVMMAYGYVPGFVPASNDEILSPNKFIKQVYVDVYGLKNHMPTILEPAWLTAANPTVYYSLGYPTLLEGHPEIVNVRNTVVDLREIKQLLINMHEYLQRNLTNFSNFKDFVENIEFEFFHKAADIYSEIKDATLVAAEDSNFAEHDYLESGRSFCTTGPFLNGCIRVTRKF